MDYLQSKNHSLPARPCACVDHDGQRATVQTDEGRCLLCGRLAGQRNGTKPDGAVEACVKNVESIAPRRSLTPAPWRIRRPSSTSERRA